MQPGGSLAPGRPASTGGGDHRDHYAVAFGGLLLLGGRAGDLLGRRRIFIAGLLVFSLASLLGGLATGQAWLIAARAAQGAGAAMAAPTALSLIAVTFPTGPPRTRATAVYSAMAILGIVAGLIAGGLLVTYASWRWVMFVNVPIGLVVAALAARVLPETGRRGGRFDLPGALTATAGVALLVYGLSNAATSPDGVSHWGDATVVDSLAASVVLLAAFAVIEIRSKRPLLPVRLLADRNRTGANLVMLCIGTAVFGMFFFLTVFLQSAWGYSALKTGVAYLPLMAGILVASGAAAQLVPRVGARPLLLAGAPATAAGLYWLSRLTEHGSYAGGVLGPMLVIAVGLGLLFMPVTLVAMSRVADQESGVAASLRNTGQQVGGAIGLALLGTVAWTVVANSIHAQAAHAPAAAAHIGHPAQPSRAALAATYHHALAAGFSRAYLVAAAIMLLALVITIVAIRIKRADLGEARH